MGDVDYHPLADPKTEVQNGMITRYVGGIGLVILLYDLILTMQTEVSGHKMYTSPLVPLTPKRLLGAISLARNPLSPKAPILHQPLHRPRSHDICKLLSV